ncbi:hypothetical protein Pmar_PMAR014849, partial [Perkinsus marinus ATCC 50983]
MSATAESSDAPIQLNKIIKDAIDATRFVVVQSHIRDNVRALASRSGEPLKDGELVVWRRPGARPIEGHVVLVSGVNVEQGPYAYLGNMVGFFTRLRPLGAPEDRSVAVSANHLEARSVIVDRARPQLALEAVLPLSSVNHG